MKGKYFIQVDKITLRAPNLHLRLPPKGHLFNHNYEWSFLDMTIS
jgi:hypothetical protein